MNKVITIQLRARFVVQYDICVSPALYSNSSFLKLHLTAWDGFQLLMINLLLLFAFEPIFTSINYSIYVFYLLSTVVIINVLLVIVLRISNCNKHVLDLVS